MSATSWRTSRERSQAEGAAALDVGSGPAAQKRPTCVCDRCGDTHTMWHSVLERHVGCTFCPTPCEACREGGTGAYCAATPCPCKCHAKKEALHGDR